MSVIVMVTMEAVAVGRIRRDEPCLARVLMQCLCFFCRGWLKGWSDWLEKGEELMVVVTAIDCFYGVMVGIYLPSFFLLAVGDMCTHCKVDIVMGKSSPTSCPLPIRTATE